MHNLKSVILFSFLTLNALSAPVPQPKHAGESPKGRPEGAPAEPSPVSGSIETTGLPAYVSKRIKLDTISAAGNFCSANHTPFIRAHGPFRPNKQEDEFLVRLGKTVSAAKIKGISNDLKPPRRLRVSPDGAHAVAFGDERALAVYDLATGENKLNLLHRFFGKTETVEEAGTFSDNGRFWITAKSDVKWPRDLKDTLITDLQTGDVHEVFTKDLERFYWISGDGQYFTAKTGLLNRLYRKDGTVLYPRRDEHELEYGSRISTTADGRTLALYADKGIRIYDLPAMKLRKQISLPREISDGPKLSPDGSYFLVQSKMKDLQNTPYRQWQFIETATGKVISSPPEMIDGSVDFCPNGKITFLKRDDKEKNLTVDLIEPNRLISNGRVIDIPNLVEEIDRAEPEEAWKALVKLKNGGVTANRARDLLKNRKIIGLPENVDKLLAKENFTDQLGSDFYAVREQASRTVANELAKTNAVTYRAKIRPALIDALKSKQIEVRKRAKSLFENGERRFGGPTADALEARFRFLGDGPR